MIKSIFWLITIFTQKHSQLIYKFIFFSLHLTKIDTEYNKITPYINDQLHFLNKEINEHHVRIYYLTFLLPMKVLYKFVL